MKVSLYAVYDCVAEEYGPPWTAINDGVACRQTRAILSTMPSRSDYLLHKLGSYDTQTGQVKSHDSIVVPYVDEEVADVENAKR